MDIDANLAPDANEMQEYDSYTIERGVPSLTLMERAGSLAAEKIRKHSAVTLGKEVVVLCGPGNNGGDGLVIARYFVKAGIPPYVIICAAKKYSNDFLQNLERLAGYAKLYLFDPDSLASADTPAPVLGKECLAPILSESRLIVDCMLGTGQSGAPKGAVAGVINVLGSFQYKGHVIAMDVPTGVNASSGEVYSPVLRADETYSVQYVKRGLLQYPARAYSGAISTLDIGIEVSVPPKFSVLSEASLTRIPRKYAGHKKDSGSVLVIGGSREMPGAAQLSARAALESGAGLVRLASPISDGSDTDEIMTVNLGNGGRLVQEHLQALSDHIVSASVVLLGPGIGLSEDTRRFTLDILRRLTIPVVLDADALTILAEQDPKDPVVASDNWVLTPHPGEFSRLSGCAVGEVQRDRYRAFLEFAEQSRAVLVLKGAGSLVGDARGGWIQCNGNPYMATAGSGDVLAGVIASFIAQGLAPLEAAKAAVFVHGSAGDLAFEEQGSLIASDIINSIPKVVRSLRKEVL